MSFGESVKVYIGVALARQGGATGDPAGITYDVRAVNTPDIVSLAAKLPERPFRDVEITAADVGHPCVIVAVGDEYRLFMLTEAVAFEDACPGDGARGDDLLPRLAAVENALRAMGARL